MKSSILLLGLLLYCHLGFTQADDYYHRKTDRFRLESLGLNYNYNLINKNFEKPASSVNLVFSYKKNFFDLHYFETESVEATGWPFRKKRIPVDQYFLRAFAME